jgi:membrane associated rhomboid family serine protease
MSLSVLIIIVTVATSLLGFRDSSLVGKLIHNPYAVVHRKEYYRLLTCGFVHADYMHLLLNMYALYLFGGAVESYFDYMFGANARLYFMILYLLGIIFSNIPDVIKYKDQSFYNSLGASGGVSSIVFASIILSPLTKLIMFPIPIPMPAYIFAIIYVAYSIYMDKRQGDKINHMAHLWGGLWGVVFMVAVYPDALKGFINQIMGSF